MKSLAQNKIYKNIALIFSLCTIIIWGILCTGASLAWFSDTSAEINNVFHFTDLDLTVSHRLADGNWEEVDSQTKIFDEEALYEPGCVQVVYLKIENKGSVPLNFHTAVNVNGCSVATNVFGQQFLLSDFLNFGVIVADSEDAINNSVLYREKAVAIADMPLHNYDNEIAMLKANETKYIALVVRMPEDVGNIANYRGETVPKVELGVTVKADQIAK